MLIVRYNCSILNLLSRIFCVLGKEVNSFLLSVTRVIGLSRVG
jgi:hypothetical protein